MASYFIDKEKYFSSDSPFPDFQKNMKNCASSMTQIINRYDIKNKKVLSLACGNGFEEFYFLQAGNSLDMSDADLPYGTITPWVKKCAVQHETDVLFTIEDCRDTPKRYENKPVFDVVYVSSLHPDEAYRGRIQSKFIRSNLLKALLTFKTFPKVDFYSEYLTPIFSILKPGGIVIMQHYGFTVPIVLNSSLIPDCSDQLKKFGLSHVETWAFKAETGNSLNVYGKMNESQTNEYLKYLDNKPAITVLNGRYYGKLAQDKKEVIKVFVNNKINFKFKFLAKINPFFHQLYRAFRYRLMVILFYGVGEFTISDTLDQIIYFQF